METDLFRMVRKGWFKAYRVDGIGYSSYDTEVNRYPCDGYNNGNFDLKIYSYGALKDIEMNGWIFGHLVKGSYHLPGSYKSVGYHIKATDPKGTEIEFFDKSFFYFKAYDAACGYFNKILFYSFFESSELVIKFNEMINYRRKLVDFVSNQAKNAEVSMEYVKFFKNYYEEKLKKNKEWLFMEEIKKQVNATLDVIIREINYYRIP